MTVGATFSDKICREIVGHIFVDAWSPMMALTYTLAQDERMSDTDARALIKDVLGLDMSQTNFKAYLNRARRCTTMEVEG